MVQNPRPFFVGFGPHPSRSPALEVFPGLFPNLRKRALLEKELTGQTFDLVKSCLGRPEAFLRLCRFKQGSHQREQRMATVGAIALALPCNQTNADQPAEQSQ